MTKRILVPLDARESSEAIVPVVAALAAGTGARVRLLRVSPIPDHVVGSHGRTLAYVDQEMARLTHEGEEDLGRAEAFLAGAAVEKVVRFGEPAEEIQREAEAMGADLIAMAAPAPGRLRALLAPPLAERVAREGSTPVLVLRG